MQRKYFENDPRDEESDKRRDILREPLRTRPVEELKKEAPRKPDWLRDYGINPDNYVSIEEGAELYSISTTSFSKLADQAGAVKWAGGRKWTNIRKFEQFVEQYRV